jgi:hypothetical protein
MMKPTTRSLSSRGLTGQTSLPGRASIITIIRTTSAMRRRQSATRTSTLQTYSRTKPRAFGRCSQRQSSIFLTMEPVSPHAGVGLRPPNTPIFGPVPVKSMHIFMATNTRVPRTGNFNPDKVRGLRFLFPWISANRFKPGGTSWLLKIPKLKGEDIQQNDEHYRQRLRALQSVDEIVNILCHISSSITSSITPMLFTPRIMG